MELEKSNSKQTTSLERTRQDGVVMLLKAKNWTELVKSVPNSVEKIMDEPLICQLVKQVGKDSLQQLLEAEIIRLANQMNVSNNINATQVPFIAETLLDTYPTESLADFILVFKRGSIGFYGNTYHKLDCATIMEWMAKHIEEKAIYRERDNTRLKQAESAVKIDYAAYIERRKKAEEMERESKIAAIVKKDELGQFREGYKPLSEEELLKRELHLEWIRENVHPITKKLIGIPEEEWLKKKG